MKTTLVKQMQFLCLTAGMALAASNSRGDTVIVKPARGGGLDTNAPMVHVEIFYDYTNNQMQAMLDTSMPTPKLVPLPAGYTFDYRSNYAVLNGKAYNFQYAWNPGGTFTPPAGAAVWIECISGSPGLECYDGPGNKMISPPRTYAPIFGTANSSAKWQWYGQMAHNSYAVLNPSNTTVSAEYRVYFGDAQTGSRDAYAQYNDATVTLTWNVDPVIVVKPARGGALDTNAPMVHVNLFYDYTNNQMQAMLDTSMPTPKLVPLPAGYAFDSRSNYAVFNGKAYNFQYAWNPGGTFSPPAGAAVWIECTNASPGLECYDGPGNKMISPPRTYAPIFGTEGSSTKWQWYGQMAHNSYAILNPTNRSVTADYLIYFGDAQTGSRDAYTQYGDASMRLAWFIDLPGAPELRFGAVDVTNEAPLLWLDAGEIGTNSLTVVNFHYTIAGPCALQHECCLPLVAVAATAANGGPTANHAALGSQLQMQLVSLAGPANGALSFWEAGEAQPRFAIRVGETAGTNCIALSANSFAPDADPYGQIQGRHFALSQPGLYCLAFQVVDTSTNGCCGDPIHMPSPVYQIYLQAGLTLSGLVRQGTAAAALFGGEAGSSFYLESSPALGASAAWHTLAGPLTGTSRLQTLTDPAPSGARLFYRLRSTTP
jgi:hypothetical protein